VKRLMLVFYNKCKKTNLFFATEYSPRKFKLYVY